MNNPRLAAYTDRLAARGLFMATYDGHTLRLNYEPSADPEIKRGPIELSDLSAFAITAMNEPVPGPELFPGVKSVVVS